MIEHGKAKIIAFVGLAGTGKSAATTYLTEKGIPKVSFRPLIIKHLEQEDLEPTAENERLVREKLRLDPSGDIVANMVITEITNLIHAGQRHIVIDGLGSWDTFKRLKHEFPGDIIIVALTARRHIRHRRLAGRTDHPMTDRETDQRDYDAIETLNKGGVIAMADYFISVEGSVEQLHTKIDELLREIEF